MMIHLLLVLRLIVHLISIKIIYRVLKHHVVLNDAYLQRVFGTPTASVSFNMILLCSLLVFFQVQDTDSRSHINSFAQTITVEYDYYKPDEPKNQNNFSKGRFNQ